jgi:hypothetical protein
MPEHPILLALQEGNANIIPLVLLQMLVLKTPASVQLAVMAVAEQSKVKKIAATRTGRK